MAYLVSTLSGEKYPFDRIQEFADNGESLEVVIPNIKNAKIRDGNFIFERFSEFMPFKNPDNGLTLGEGNTPLLKINRSLQEWTGIDNLFIKNETQNPTWSFKDRGSLSCIFMSKERGEKFTATISTGNMGNSISAYGANAGIKVVVFVPNFTPKEKIMAMSIHGAIVVRVNAPDYSFMKKEVLNLADKFKLRIVSGNGPIRVEGYKLTAFEIFEQMKGNIPDYIAVPTSACGHIRGLFKGFRELMEAGIIAKLPKMVVVQAKNNSPIVSAIKSGKKDVIPFLNFHTIAEAITSGNPMGGDEIIDKTFKHGWVAEDVSEDEILESQQRLALSGFFVEPASATSLYAVKKLREANKIKQDDTVILMLTGSGLKDFDAFQYHKFNAIESNINKVQNDLENILNS